jgi:hypothetical protein
MRTKQDSQRGKNRPAVTIIFETWSIPIIGVLMLIIGAFAGYNLRLQSNPQTNQSAVSPQLQRNPQQSLGGDQEDLMEYVLSQVRHFRGDPDAPVTMIEFGDFQ